MSVALFLSETTLHQNAIIEGSTKTALETTSNYLISGIGEDVSLSCPVNRRDSDKNVWYKVKMDKS